MFLFITILFPFVAALTLAVLQAMRPNYRFAWLIAVGGAFLAWVSVLLWRLGMPLTLELPSWGPVTLFGASPVFLADGVSWPYVFALTTLGLTVLLTAVGRENFPAPLTWAGVLALTGMGMLAPLAANPLTLALVWGALDLTELVVRLASVEERAASERIVAGFAARALGLAMLLWAGLFSLQRGAALDFRAPLPEVSVFLILAAGLRLGVLPLHLAYETESTLRRDLGTTLRLVSAASSLAVLARAPMQESFPSLLFLTAAAGLYGAWRWMSAPDVLTGRPFWVIGLASLSLAAALRGNPTGSIGWGLALVVTGSALFLFSIQHKTLQRLLWAAGVWSLSSLPFSLTAGGWLGASRGWLTWAAWPLLIGTQALLAAGLIRHVSRTASFGFESQAAWVRTIFPIGIVIPLASVFALGLIGWQGARLTGALPAALAAAALTGALFWLTPRVRWLNPVRAHWVRSNEEPVSRLDAIYRFLWDIYRALGRLSEALAAMLEGEGGLLWALLFLVLFISMILPRIP